MAEWGWTGGQIQETMAERKRAGNCCLFVFARVCREYLLCLYPCRGLGLETQSRSSFTKEGWGSCPGATCWDIVHMVREEP